MPWMPADAYGKTLTGLSLNLIVRDLAKSVPFYRDVLGMMVHYSDEDMAAVQLDTTQIVLHADHTYDKQPWASRLPETGKRGATILLGARDWPHGWRDVVLEDPDGYTFAVGTVLP